MHRILKYLIYLILFFYTSTVVCQENTKKKKYRYRAIRQNENEMYWFAIPSFSLTYLPNSGFNYQMKNQFNYLAMYTSYFGIYSKYKFAWSSGIGYTNFHSRIKYNLNNTYSILDFSLDQLNITESGNIAEDFSFSFVEIPLIGIIDRSVGLNSFVQFGGGFSLLYPINSSYTTTGNWSREGYYPRYNARLYDINATGTEFFFPSNNTLNYTNDIKVDWDLRILLMTGFKFRLYNRFGINTGIKYSIGLTNLVRNHDQPGTFRFYEPPGIYQSIVNNDYRLYSFSVGGYIGVVVDLNKKALKKKAKKKSTKSESSD